MVCFGILQIFSTVLECLWLGRKTDREKDLEILLLSLWGSVRFSVRFDTGGELGE